MLLGVSSKALRPDAIARELGLEFSVEEPAKSTMKVLRFTFKFPDMTAEPDAYAETVARVTHWSTRVKAWTFVTPDSLPIVAAELTFGNRRRVALVNRKTRKALAMFWSDEAQARRLALSQPTPQQALKVLDETPRKQRETKLLRAKFVEAIAVLERPDTVADLEPNVVVGNVH